jgi:hypothetical protein
LLLAMPKHESLRANGGRLIAGATCITPCVLRVHGYLTVGGRKLAILRRRLTFSGHRRFLLRMSPAAQLAVLARAKAHRTTQAHLFLEADRAHVGAEQAQALQQPVTAAAQIQLRP